MQNILVIDGLVHEIIEPMFDGEKEIPLEKRFHKDILDQVVSDPNSEAVIGGTWGDNNFGQIPIYAPSWDDIRHKRNGLLAGSDWISLGDSPLPDEDKKSYIEYRQKLRDIPQDFKEPNKVVWPDKP